MHRWHCRCDNCRFDSGYKLYAQTDSSCSGEVITTILHHDPASDRYVGDLFEKLESAALAVDAEPGTGAGMHVHVQQPKSKNKVDTLWAFLRNEGLFQAIAAGRFQTVRGCNERLRYIHSYHMQEYIGHDYRVDSDRGVDKLEQDLTSIDLDCLKDEVYDTQTIADRHSNLNIATGHGTWEFRIWNSTRAAWRMELFSRLSVALVDPDVVERTLTMPIGSSPEHVDRFAVLLDSLGHERCAELVDRQNTYAQTSSYPSALTTY